jgi:hypothetical protein
MLVVVRRPRLFGPLVAGGIGYAIGRSRRPAVPPPAAVPPAEMTEKLKELTALHDSGALSDEEFAAAKRKLVGL